MSSLEFVLCEENFNVKKLNTENYLGHNDWRLPNINELKSIVDIQMEGYILNWLNEQGFTIQDNGYWSSTSRAAATQYAGVGFIGGSNVDYIIKTGNYYVWPVRSGQSGSLTLPKTGQKSCYNATGSTISCSGTGQDGELQAGTAWPIPRFTDNSLSNSAKMTVTDNLTSLVWSKNANLVNGTKRWHEALDYVKTLNSISFSGHNDWRMPNINELKSLVNLGQSFPYNWLKEQGFTNVQSDYNYWSATSLGGGTYAWVVEMYSGSMLYDNKIYADHYNYVWPVRGGQSVAIDSLTFSVAKSGTGTGTVTSSIGGISCGTTCSASITTGTSVTLTAAPSSGSTFTGWTGACGGTGTCTVTMDAAKSVTATFALAPTTAKPGDCDNSGTVSIAEVQSSINMFLGLKAAEVCVNIDSSSSVSISEVQKVINSFLGL